MKVEVSVLGSPSVIVLTVSVDVNQYSTRLVGPFRFTSTEARWVIRDVDREGRGRKSEGSTADTARKRPERPWTAARTMEVLRRCPLAIAQRLVHCAIAVSTAVLGQSHKDNVRCTAVEEQLETKEVELSQPNSTSLLMISSGLECPAPPPSSRSFDLAWNLDSRRKRTLANKAPNRLR